ncbi:adhesion G protein-coupled receptor E2-like isoform X2 [Macrobrachium nipponense]|uniref:adhesion G protein-coupled receptor E2-like isoform X2 n=1 Tax=Macrobrachium nipponense TaxID=159736 RepID=UPI0030C8AF84
MTAITIAFLAVVLTASEFAYSQLWQDIYVTEARIGIADLKKKQNEILGILTALRSGFEDHQQKQNDILSEMQKKLDYIENNLQGAVNNIQDSLQDECSEGSHNCTDYEACTDKFVHFTCTCLSGFARDGSRCEDVDECAQGKDECSPLATCRNSVGSYSCSCNPPFEGDGRTCEFPCRSPAKVLEGLGCVKFVQESKTFEEMNATCHQAGGRLLQNFSYEHLQEVVRAFGIGGIWIGVHEGKWLESGLPLQEELWTEGSRESDPSRRNGLCGGIDRVPSSLYKVSQRKCSERWWGYCQFVTPQK